ncbi:MAG TPA: aromatic ring-hydroxylating dioxygenase subunit alpha [Acidimicrobiia bacterium]|nr:aromatic ring-hydroxylating dioxygenase subunit alpha [Acidimicrobiia bacterium]
MVDPTRMLANADPALRRAWHPVARSSEVTAAPRKTRLLGDDWVLVRLPVGAAGSTLAAFADRCPHRLAPLSAGCVDGSFLRCGYHGWCFDATGACREIPSLGGSERVPPRAVATTPAAVAEQHGMVFLAPEEPRTELLEIPEADDPAFVHGSLEPVTAAVGAGLMIDNFLDMAHFPFVHAATIGAPESSQFELDVQREGFGMRVYSRHPFPNREDPGVAAGVRPLLQERVLEYRYRAPFSICLRIDYVEAGGTNVLDFYVQPEDDTSCRIYTTVHRNDLGDDDARLAECVAFERKILDEDLALQEQYRDLRLPLELTTEVHVKADRMTIELRRILADLVTSPVTGDDE